VLPAQKEPFGMTIIEAMAAGRPVVVASDAALADAVSKAGAGWTFGESGDHPTLEQAMIAALDDDVEEHGRRALLLVERRFRIDAVLDALETDYAQVARPGARERSGTEANGTTARQPRILWVTNIASPYRRPVWKALGAHCALLVGLLENDDQLNRNGRRGSDWLAPLESDRGYRIRHFRTWMLNRGEEAHFTLRPGSLRSVRRCDAVLLGGWDSPAYWQLLVVAKLRRIRAVGFYESTAETNRFRRGPIAAARTWFFRHLDAVVVPGRASASLLESLGVDPSRIHVGFNAVDVRGFAESAGQARAAHPVPIGEQGHRFVYVGQLIDRKNVDGALRAFAAVRETGDRLDLIGTGPQQAALQRLSEQLQIDGSVRFTGFVPNTRLASVLAQEHTLLLPSHKEVWGLVVNEALACGLQVVVASDAGVTSSIVGMPGVTVIDTGAGGLERAMRRARSAWSGPVEEPPILDRTPESFARVFAAALGVEWGAAADGVRRGS
jgi:glycosyltransferase involved in cell wall biosynthesis